MDSYVNSRSPPTISPLVIFIIRDMRIFLSSRAWNNLFSRKCVNMTGWNVWVNVLRILHFDWNVFDWSIFINFKLALKCFNITIQQWLNTGCATDCVVSNYLHVTVINQSEWLWYSIWKWNTAHHILVKILVNLSFNHTQVASFLVIDNHWHL